MGGVGVRVGVSQVSRGGVRCRTWHCALMRAMKGQVADSPAQSTSRYSSSSGFWRGEGGGRVREGGRGEKTGEG